MHPDERKFLDRLPVLLELQLRSCTREFVKKVTKLKIGFTPKIEELPEQNFSSDCPKEEPTIGEPCSLPSDVGPCSYGLECCCGECHPRYIFGRISPFDCQDVHFQVMQLLSIPAESALQKKPKISPPASKQNASTVSGKDSTQTLV